MSTAPVRPSRAIDRGLRERARRVIPNGLYGHLNTSRLTDDYPQFLARGEGARVWDVDGREFIDLMCTFGPILLGHAQPEAAAAVTATGSFWYAAAPMAAVLTTIRLLKESDGIGRMRASGLRLQEGLRAQARAHDLAVRVSGPPQMPLLLFADDPEFARSLAWSGACAAHGVYLHPVHNWFLNAAHDEATIDEVLERTDAAFDEIRDRFGAG